MRGVDERGDESMSILEKRKGAGDKNMRKVGEKRRGNVAGARQEWPQRMEVKR